MGLGSCPNLKMLLGWPHGGVDKNCPGNYLAHVEQIGHAQDAGEDVLQRWYA